MFPISAAYCDGWPHSAPLTLDVQTSPEPISIDALIAANTTSIYNVFLRLLRDPSAAEDACQETMIAAWRHRDDGVLGRAWLIHVASNKCRDELRRRARRPSITLDRQNSEVESASSCLPTPEAVVLQSDNRRLVERGLMQLPWAQRVALVLGDVERWSYREIADMTGTSLGTVKSRIFRGRIRLRELLTQGSKV